MVPQIQTLIDRGALFVINHSAGKDSQAMAIKLQKLIPKEQLLMIHAKLGRIEWQGTVEHIENTAGHLPLIVCRNLRKTYLEMVRARGKFPSPQQRQCTSDLKRDPIAREIRRHLKAHPEFGGLVVNCIGLRAEESPDRRKRKPLTFSKRNSAGGREWYEWLPILDMLEHEVFETIAEAGQKPHWAYAAGMTRLSCAFCIMASQRDLQTAARLRPKLYRDICALETEIGHTMKMCGRTLPEITGVAA